MNKRVITIFLPAVLVLISVACKSTPAPAPAKTTTPSTVTRAPADALRGPTSRAQEARTRAMDFDAPAYFPSDWEIAENQLSRANNMTNSTDSETQNAAAAYNEAADAYDELFEKTIPLYAQAREDEIMALRNEITNSGFTDFLPNCLEETDEIALAALSQYEAKDYYKARDTAAEALKEYQTLNLGAKVYLTRQEIINRGFRDYDPENFDKADDIAQTALDEYEAGNKGSAVTNAEEALLRFNIVLTNGWTAYASEKRAAAILERERALENKANIAVRESFRDADTVFNQAEDNFKTEVFDSAATQFTEAEARFMLSTQETEEKRLKALETIMLAEEKIGESVETAAEAEKIIEGGSR